jgi:HEPN domain-containing protein
MNPQAKQWLDYAEADLLASEKLLNDVFLTNIVAFHSHQVIEKSFKAIIEYKGLRIPKVHSLSKLYGTIEHTLDFPIDVKMLQKTDTIYTVSRYPADIGLLPHGKPSGELAKSLYEFAKYVFKGTNNMIS